MVSPGTYYLRTIHVCRKKRLRVAGHRGAGKGKKKKKTEKKRLIISVRVQTDDISICVCAYGAASRLGIPNSLVTHMFHEKSTTACIYLR